MSLESTNVDSTPAGIAAARRSTLARSYFVDGEVQRRLSIDEATLVQWRKAGRILAVWHAPERRYLYPPYQFNGDNLVDEIERLLSLRGGVSQDRSGWAIVEWLHVPHVLLNGQRPCEILASETKRVIAAAKIEFCGF